MLAKRIGRLTLNLKTHSRDQLIDLSKVIANSFQVTMLQHSEDIAYIQILGDMWAGKSMLVEAMMKTLLDQHDADDMKRPDAKQEMFIEREPNYAREHYCQAIGRTDGVPVMYGFDRISETNIIMTPTSNWSQESMQRELVKTFQNAAAKHGVPPVGAIFARTDAWHFGEPWMILDLECKRGHAGGAWKRSLKIDIFNKRLMSSPHFKHYWKYLESFAKSGILQDAALRAPVNGDYNFDKRVALNLKPAVSERYMP